MGAWRKLGRHRQTPKIEILYLEIHHSPFFPLILSISSCSSSLVTERRTIGEFNISLHPKVARSLFCAVKTLQNCLKLLQFATRDFHEWKASGY